MSQTESHHDEGDIVYPSALPFVLAHLACLGAIWSGVTATSVWLAIGLYWLRMFAVTGGYHRYFSHRTYKTSRAGQFLLALLAQSTAQKSVLWWASKHRHHHRYADTEHDVHSPVQTSFAYSHLGWIFSREHHRFDDSAIQDLTKFPELRLLHRFETAPAILLALICFAIDGWAGLFVGFFWSTVACYHATFCINSLAHVHGDKHYVTGDESRNNWWLAVITMGEGWHNNHHAYQYSVRQGFRWWQWDPTYYIIRGLAKLRLVWDLKEPPQAVIERSQALPPRVIERSAERLAASVPLDRIAAAFHEAYAATPSLPELHLPTLTAAELRSALAELQQRASERLHQMQQQAHDAVAGWHLPVLPSREELSEKAASMFARTPSLDAIAARAHDMLVEAWPEWPDAWLRLVGPEGAGKTHLAAIWAKTAHAWTVKASEVTQDSVAHLISGGALVVEDCDQDPRDEAALFHLMNAVKAKRGALLLTARNAPEQWGLQVPDLLSRLRLAPQATIAAPDDALLRAVLVKLFIDRQLVVDTSVIEALTLRMERSFAAARQIVDALDRRALERGRRVTRLLVQEVLAELFPEQR